jgi:hypothetical protein
MNRVERAWREITEKLNEAELVMLYEMLGQSIQIKQMMNVLETPESEDDLLSRIAVARHEGEIRN